MIIRVHKLRVEAFVGIHPHEKAARQPVELDIELDCDIASAALTDTISDTVDYDRLSRDISRVVQSTHFNLLERMVAEVACLCLEDGRVNRATVRISKPNALESAENVSLELTRERA